MLAHLSGAELLEAFQAALFFRRVSAARASEAAGKLVTAIFAVTEARFGPESPTRCV